MTWELRFKIAIMHSGEMFIPQDTVVLANEVTTLNCTKDLSMKEVIWNFYNITEPKNKRTIYSASKVQPEYANSISIINGTSNEFNLRINKTTLDHAGVYKCFRGFGNEPQAQLTVLGEWNYISSIALILILHFVSRITILSYHRYLLSSSSKTQFNFLRGRLFKYSSESYHKAHLIYHNRNLCACVMIMRYNILDPLLWLFPMLGHRKGAEGKCPGTHCMIFLDAVARAQYTCS